MSSAPLYKIDPPTEAFRNRWQAARWRNDHLRLTSTPEIRVAFLNLANASVDVGALQEMIVPVVREIKSGAFGPLALGVITTDDAVVGFLSYLAKEHSVPLFVTNSTVNPQHSARPIGELTPADAETLERVLALGGRVTSSQFAAAAALEPAAAGNRLSNVEKKGFLFRVQRPRNQGDLFVDPRTVPESPAATSTTETTPLYIPAEIRSELEAVASEHDRSPTEVLAEVWRAYFHAHRDELDEELRRVDQMIDAGDDAALLDYTTSDVGERAAQAARRARNG